MALEGLPISPYFSALKIRWLKDHIPAVRKACRERRCLAGTVDSWLIWVNIYIYIFLILKKTIVFLNIYLTF